MVKIANREDLREWLKDQSQDVALAIAFRASLRSLPLNSRSIDNYPVFRNLDDDLALWLRCSLVSVVACTNLIPEITQISSMAAAAAVEAYASGAGDVDAAYSSYATAAAISDDIEVDAACSIDDDADPVFWAAISADIRFLERAEDVAPAELLEQPIWQDSLPGLMADPIAAFASYLRGGEHLVFWARWYERMASGNPMNWEMQKEIALIPDEDWKQGAVHVSKLIAEIEAKYATQTLPLAEDLEVDGDGRVYAVPVPVPQGDVYAEALEAVQDALDDALLGDNQALKSDDLEARILSRTLEKYRETPYRVHQDFTIVRDNLRGKLGDVFAQDHAPIVNLIRAVEDGAVNIRRAAPRVRETLKANAWVRLKDASPEEREAIVALLSSIEAIAREDFAEDLAEDRVQIAAPTSEAEVTDALYRTGNRAAKIRQMVIDGTIRGSTGLIAGTALGEAIVMILRLLGL